MLRCCVGSSAASAYALNLRKMKMALLTQTSERNLQGMGSRKPTYLFRCTNMSMQQAALQRCALVAAVCIYVDAGSNNRNQRLDTTPREPRSTLVRAFPCKRSKQRRRLRCISVNDPRQGREMLKPFASWSHTNAWCARNPT